MAASPWLIFRQARESLRADQPDEARRLVAPLAAEGYRKAIKLTREIAKCYLARAERHLRADNTEAAWNELLAAESLNTGADTAIKLRHTLTRLGLVACRAALEAGNPFFVIETAERLRNRRAEGPELLVLEELAQDWMLASEQADRGEFLLAKSTFLRVAAKFDPTTDGPSRFLAELDRRHDAFRIAVAELYEAMEDRRWEQAVKAADDAVAAAPSHREARSLRVRAWEALPRLASVSSGEPSELVRLMIDGPSQAAPGDETRSWNPARPVVALPYHPATPTRNFGPAPSNGSVTSTAGEPPSTTAKRFLLWIDGVGGYLVCLSSRVTFGQATADGPIDVPLFADVARLHAEIARDEEGYVLESGREVQVNGHSAKRAVLACGDRITLGATCQLVFRKPVPISPTARLELVSGHRLPLAVDGVLLMAESLLLGSRTRSHVGLPSELPGNVVIYRTKEGLGVKYEGNFTIDGKPCQGRSPLSLPGVVSADRFTFAVEPVGVRI